MHDVFITGRGLISPAGSHLNSHWDRLVQGHSALRSVKARAMGRLTAKDEQRLHQLAEDKSFRPYDRATLLAVLAARDAVAEAGAQPGRGWISVVGSSRGATGLIEESLIRHFEGERLRPSTSPTTTLGSFSSAVARATGCAGLSLSLSAACATSLHAIGITFLALKTGFAQGALAGGAEAPLTPYTFAMLEAAKVLSPSLAAFPCRPFHPDREGMVLGEGGAVLALSVHPGASPLAQIVGYGAASESATLTGISEDGVLLQEAINDALKMARLEPSDVDLVIGHGSGTPKGDAAEARAYQGVFGEQGPPIALHKWLTGHLLGAAGAFSVAMATEHLQRGVVPRHPYFADNLSSALASSHEIADARHGLVTSLGFGGNAAALVIKVPR